METVSPTDVGIFLGCVAFLLGIAVALKKLFERNPPLYREFASRDEHEALKSEFSDFREEIRAALSDAADTSRQSREKIYIEQRRQAELLSRTSEKTDLTFAQLQNLDAKVDRVLERLPR